MTLVTVAPDPTASGVGDPPGAPVHPTFAWAAILAVIGAKSAVNLAVANRYGWHIDELYYRSAGQHPMLGYTDFPPLVPMIARLAEALFGPSLVGLRLFAILAGAGTILVTAATARELGGRRWAQAVAALAAAAPTLGSNAMFQTVSFDQLTWALLVLAAIRVLKRGTRRSWIQLGAAIALSALTKYTVLVPLLLLVIGFLGTRTGRARLRGPGVAWTTIVAVVPVLPNLWWQARHGWPSVEFFTGRNADVRADYPPQKFVAEFLIMAGPTAWWLVVGGLRSLWRDPRLRAVAITVAAVPPAYLVLGGKGYYALPVVFVAYGAGAVAAQDRISACWRRWLPVTMIVVPLACSPLILPVLPQGLAQRSGIIDIRSDYGAEIGWPQLVDAVGAAWQRLPNTERSHTILLAGDYGEAGALDRWGHAHGLPEVISGHLSHRYWPPSGAGRAATAVLAVGYTRAELAPDCAAVTRVGSVPDVTGMLYGAGEPILLCVLPGTVADLWPHLAHD